MAQKTRHEQRACWEGKRKKGERRASKGGLTPKPILEGKLKGGAAKGRRGLQRGALQNGAASTGRKGCCACVFVCVVCCWLCVGWVVGVMFCVFSTPSAGPPLRRTPPLPPSPGPPSGPPLKCARFRSWAVVNPGIQTSGPHRDPPLRPNEEPKDPSLPPPSRGDPRRPHSPFKSPPEG